MPQVTVTLAGGLPNVGKPAGETVIVLDTGAIVLPQASVPAHVSMIVPPQTPGVAVLVELLVPLIRQFPEPPLV